MANGDLGLAQEEKKKRLPTAEEAFGPEPKGIEPKGLPTVEEAFGPEPTKPTPQKFFPPLKEYPPRMMKTIMDVIPPLNLLRPSWQKEYGEAPVSKELPAGALTGGEYTPEELARVAAEGKTKESMAGEIAGRSLENIALAVPGGPAETAVRGGLKLAGKVVSPVVKKGIEFLPPWMRRGPGSFKTKAEEILESVKAPYGKVEPSPAPKVSGVKPAEVKPPVAKPAPAEVKPPVAKVEPSPVPKEATPVPSKTRMPPRKGAATEIEELKNIEADLYQRAEAATPKGVQDKINVEKYNDYLNKFTEKGNKSFGRLKPPEKKEIRQVINQIQEEISPEIRGGLRGRTRVNAEDFADLIERGGFGDIGVITEPGTFTSARATRSWLSEESAKAFKSGNKNLGIAYNKLKKALEKDLEKSVGKEPWAAWKEADSFKTRRHVMDEVFGPKAESRPGKYDFKKIKKNVDKINNETPWRFENAGFSEKEINAISEISDAAGWRLTIENHPSLKLVIPMIALEMIGIPTGVRLFRHAASLTHVVPGGGLGGY